MSMLGNHCFHSFKAIVVHCDIIGCMIVVLSLWFYHWVLATCKFCVYWSWHLTKVEYLWIIREIYALAGQFFHLIISYTIHPCQAFNLFSFSCQYLSSHLTPCMLYILNSTHCCSRIISDIIFVNKYNLAYYFCGLLRHVGVIKLCSMCDLQNFEVLQDSELSHVCPSVRLLHLSLLKLNGVCVCRTLVIHHDRASERHSTTSGSGIPLPCPAVIPALTVHSLAVATRLVSRIGWCYATWSVTGIPLMLCEAHHLTSSSSSSSQTTLVPVYCMWVALVFYFYILLFDKLTAF